MAEERHLASKKNLRIINDNVIKNWAWLAAEKESTLLFAVAIPANDPSRPPQIILSPAMSQKDIDTVLIALADDVRRRPSQEVPSAIPVEEEETP